MEHKTFSSSYSGTRDTPAFMGLHTRKQTMNTLIQQGEGREPGKDCVRWECLRSEVNRAAREPGKELEKKQHNREQWKGGGRGRQALCSKHSKEDTGLRGAASDTAGLWTPRWELAHRLKWEAN